MNQMSRLQFHHANFVRGTGVRDRRGIWRRAARIRAGQRALDAVSVNNDDIGGVVTSAKGPEAGVWVIAETSDLPTRYRKIVVTDDAGRYMLPDLPKANYKVWVRGYGLVDSKKVDAACREERWR